MGHLFLLQNDKKEKNFKDNIFTNKVDYIKATGTYCTVNSDKVKLFMAEFSSGDIISHHFIINNNEGGMGIGYDMIVSQYLMVNTNLIAN